VARRGNPDFVVGRVRYAASALNFTHSACTTFMIVANSRLPSADSALQTFAAQAGVACELGHAAGAGDHA
jgi:hypothetical protein